MSPADRIRPSSTEGRILAVAGRLMTSGIVAFHGYQLAQELEGAPDRVPTIGYGTLYRALDRLERIGYLRSWWVEPAAPGRPRRRLYQLTAAGIAAAPLPELALVPVPVPA